MARLPCKDYLKGICTTPFCEKWHPPECLFYKSENGWRFGEKCSYAHRQVDEQPSKKSQKNGDKSAVATLKSTRQLGCVFQYMEPPKSTTILRKSSNILKPIRCVRFTKAVLRHANIRDQNPSLGMICPGDPHQRNPNAPKFEDRSQEEMEWQERCARDAAWRLAKNILKLKEKHKTPFFSPSENWCLPAPSTLKPEEREFVVDSGASMHMISKKDLNSSELENRDDIEKSDDGYNSQWWSADEWRGHNLCQRIGYILDNECLRGYASSFYRWESFAMNTDTHMNGSMVKNHISLKTIFEYSVIRKTSYQWWFLVYQRVLPQARLPQHPWHLQRRLIIQITVQHSCQAKVWIDKYGETRILLRHQKSCWINQPKSQNRKNENHEQVRGDPYHSDIPEWLQEFKENLVDDRVPERRDSHASSSHEPSLVPMPARSVDLGKYSVYTHFPKDRNCEICQRTKISRAPCRRRIGGAVPRAENFGDLITADHKFLSESCESRNNHRYAIVVQDLATQWIQSYPCKTKTSQETQRSLQKFLEPDRKSKVIFTDNSLDFGKACEGLSWNHFTSTPHRSETNGIAERAVRRVKEGASAVLLQSGLNESWWADSMECYTNLRNIQDLLSDGKTPYERRFGEPFKGPIIPFGSLVEHYPISAKDQSIIHQFGKKVFPGLFLGYALYAGGIWKGDVLIADLEELETMDASDIYSERLNAKEVIFHQKYKIYIPGRRWISKTFWRRSGTENIHLDTGPPNSRRRSKRFSWIIRSVSTFTTSRLISGWRWSKKRFLVHVMKTSYTAITLNPESNFTRREKNHSLFHWNTLTSPELHTRIWMSSKKAASMIIGISMDQEICLILEQVSLSVLY